MVRGCHLTRPDNQPPPVTTCGERPTAPGAGPRPSRPNLIVAWNHHLPGTTGRPTVCPGELLECAAHVPGWPRPVGSSSAMPGNRRVFAPLHRIPQLVDHIPKPFSPPEPCSRAASPQLPAGPAPWWCKPSGPAKSAMPKNPVGCSGRATLRGAHGSFTLPGNPRLSPNKRTTVPGRLTPGGGSRTDMAFDLASGRSRRRPLPSAPPRNELVELPAPGAVRTWRPLLW